MAGFWKLPPGWNLWITGPPNYCKPGAFPMTALVEADQLSYIATMNWQLTHPGQWVSWQKGEPYAFVMPVRRGDVESFEAKIELLQDYPELQAQHDAWAADRNGRGYSQSFLYAKGQQVDGTKFPYGHQTKLKLCPFNDSGHSRLG
jgi:hypothetical protein